MFGHHWSKTPASWHLCLLVLAEKIKFHDIFESFVDFFGVIDHFVSQKINVIGCLSVS